MRDSLCLSDVADLYIGMVIDKLWLMVPTLLKLAKAVLNLVQCFNISDRSTVETW